jgi:hypothetical protein
LRVAASIDGSSKASRIVRDSVVLDSVVRGPASE